MRRLAIAALLLSPLAVTLGCPATPPSEVQPSPSPTVSFVPQPVPPEGSYSNSGIEVFGGSMFVEIKANDQPVKGATLKVYGPTLATAVTNDNGQANLSPLAEGTGYRLVVEAPGYATLQVGNIEIKKKITTPERLTMSQGASLKGRVLANGQPLAGAVVSDGLNSTLTDSQGSYTLSGVNSGTVTLTAGKSRYQTVSRSVDVAGQGASGLDLTLSATTPVAYFDNSVAPGVPLSKFSGLQKALSDKGWQISNAPPEHEGVWVLVSPTQVLPQDTIERLVTFVAQGGKLVVFGEWGGYSGFQNAGTNALAHALGLHFNPDLIRDPAAGTHQEWLNIRTFQPGLSAVQGIQSVKLYQSASLFGLSPMTILAQTAAGAYHVQDDTSTGPWNVAMGGPYKAGKAIALGDTTAFADEDTDGNGTPNIAEADNSRFIVQLFDW